MAETNLTLTAVAEEMGVSTRTVRRWIKSGRLKAYKPGREFRIPQSAFQEFLKANEVESLGPLSFGRWLEKRFGHSYLTLDADEIEDRFASFEGLDDEVDRKQALFAEIHAEYLATTKTRWLPSEERLLVKGHHKEATTKWLLAQRASGQVDRLTAEFEQSIREALAAATGSKTA